VNAPAFPLDRGHITYHGDLIQGSEEWLAQRCGLITGSEVKLLLSAKTLKPLNNDKTRAHIWELAAQRITNYVEPTYIGDEMLRGHDDEITARDLYAKHYAPVTQCGFVTNDEFGFTIGCSPDALVGDDGGLECKSRRQKFQVQTFVEHYRGGGIPEDFVLQVQTELLVTRRPWWHFISFSGGLPMRPILVEPDPEIQQAIIEVAREAERQIEAIVADWNAALAAERFIPTERRVDQEMYV
jgi:hypothetical protein